MIRQAFARTDPMVRLLIAALVLATLLPVRGEARPVAQNIANVFIFFLFFLNGLRLARADVLRGIGNMRFLAPLVLWCFGVMALAGWAVSAVMSPWLPPVVVLGFLYLGTLPSTVQSATSYTSMAGGNVAVSVVAAALLNILGFFLTAPLFSLLAGSETFSLGGSGLTKVFLILLLPFLLGQLAQARARHWVSGHRQLVIWMDRLPIAIAVYVAFSAAVEQHIWGRLGVADWAALLAGVAAILVIGFGGAWIVSRLCGLARADRIAFLFAGGQKSIAMGAPLAAILFAPAQAGMLLIPLLIYHLLQLMLSAPIAGRFSRG